MKRILFFLWFAASALYLFANGEQQGGGTGSPKQGAAPNAGTGISSRAVVAYTKGLVPAEVYLNNSQAVPSLPPGKNSEFAVPEGENLVEIICKNPDGESYRKSLKFTANRNITTIQFEVAAAAESHAVVTYAAGKKSAQVKIYINGEYINSLGVLGESKKIPVAEGKNTLEVAGKKNRRSTVFNAESSDTLIEFEISKALKKVNNLTVIDVKPRIAYSIDNLKVARTAALTAPANTQTAASSQTSTPSPAPAQTAPAVSAANGFVIEGTKLVKYTGAAETIVIPESLGITEIGSGAFRETKVKSVTLPSTVRVIGGSAFYSCKQLTQINIPSGVTQISDSTFYNCGSLAGITLPDTVTAINNNAFQGVGLKELTIPKSVKTLSDIFLYNCSPLAAITVHPENTNYVSVNGILFNKDMTTLMIYPAQLPGVEYAVPAGVKTINSYAFNYSRNLLLMKILASVTKIGNNAIYNSSRFTTFQVDPANTAFSAADGVLFDKDRTKIVWYPEYKTGDSYTVPAGVKTIASDSFWYTPET